MVKTQRTKPKAVGKKTKKERKEEKKSEKEDL